MSNFKKIVASHEITRDENTGLEWQTIPFPNAMTFDEAGKACADLRLGGHADWRRPTLRELQSIHDVKRFNPAIDTEFFPDTPSEGFWTSDVDAEDPSEYAWVVGFDYGGSYLSARSYRFRVRAVRGPSRQ